MADSSRLIAVFRAAQYQSYNAKVNRWQSEALTFALTDQLELVAYTATLCSLWQTPPSERCPCFSHTATNCFTTWQLQCSSHCRFVIEPLISEFGLAILAHMTSSHPALEELRACVRPILIDSGVAEAPFGIWGTGVLVSYRSRVYFVTAAHLVRNVPPSDVCVLLSEGAKRRLPLSRGIGCKPEDEVDLVVFPAESIGLEPTDVGNVRVVSLDEADCGAWLMSAHVAKFGVVGYPRILASANYDVGSARVRQAWLPSRYRSTVSGDPFLHTVDVDNPLGLGEFGGFSGGAVFSIQVAIAAPAIRRLCGIALAGTPTSGTIQFVDVQSVLHLVKTAHRDIGRFGLPLPDFSVD